MLKKFGYANANQIPRLQKVVINMGIAEASKDKNSIQDCVKELTMLSGQKPIITKARKAISNFKLREDQPIGIKVLCADYACRILSIAFLILYAHVSGTFEVFQINAMAEEIIA